MKRVSAVFAACLAFSALPAWLRSQVATGNIRGTVTDVSEAVISGAKVTLVNVNTGLPRSATTNESGDFNAPSMPLGDYQITVEVPGFQRKVLIGINLQVDQTATIRIVLEPGAVTQSVEVSSAAPLLESQTSSIGQVIENKRIVELPLNGRNPFALGLLAGGTTPFYGLTTNLPFVGGGGRYSANDILLDGVDDNIRNYAGSVGRNGVGYIPSVDAVQEFKVKTNNFAAEYGRSAGYTVNATIRSGSNELHGAIFEFLRNDVLDANNFVSNFAGRPKSKFRQNQFGGTLGGPVRFPGYSGRNRTFFFADYQGTEIRQAAGSSLADVAPAAFRGGDFSGQSRQIFDPATRRLSTTGIVIADSFPGNLIPQTRMDPAVLKYQSLMPLPNVGPANSTSRNFISTSPNELARKQGDIRVDHTLFQGNTLMARFSISNQSQPNQGSYIYSPQETLYNTRNAVFSDTHIVSPHAVNEFHFGYNRSNSSQVALKSAQASAFAAQNGLRFGPVIGFPSVNFNYTGDSLGPTEFSGFGAADSTLNYENSFQWADNVSVIRGNHTFKAGAELRRFRFDQLPGFPMSGSYIFGSFFTANPSVSQATGLPYADFLLGVPAIVTAQNQIDFARQRDLYFGAYVQDDWKFSRRLTFNLGFRYDLFTQPVDALNTGGVFDPFTKSSLGRYGVIRIPGKDGNSRAIVRGYHRNFAPRFGFAYQASRNFVVRGGYGIFYSQREQNRQVTEIANTLTNFRIITTPQVIPATTVTPPIHFTGPLTVESALDPAFSRYDARNSLGTAFLTADINNSKFPNVQQFNLSLEYEFTGGFLAEASYSGAHGVHWVQRINVNTVPFEWALIGKNTQADRPFPFVQQSIGYDTAIVASWYNAFNLRLERRFSRGLTFLINYTISRAVDSGGSGSSLFSQQGDTRALDAYNLRLEKGISPLDIPRKFVTSAVYELPFGPGKRFLHHRGSLGHIVGGWQVNGILSLRSGFPTDLRVTQNPPVFNTANRPNVVLGEPLLEPNPGFDQYFNPKAFVVPPTVPDYRGNPIQTFGNAGRAILRGPGARNLDLSLFKEFRHFAPSDTMALQFRAEAFNLSNTPTFQLPSAVSAALTVGNPSFGKLSGSQSVGRQVQFGLKLIW